MQRQQLNEKLDALATMPEVTPEQLQEIIIDFLNHLQEIIKNDKIDAILENIEDRVEDDKFGVLAFIVNFIKVKRLG
jgi:hypothetical protein